MEENEEKRDEWNIILNKGGQSKEKGTVNNIKEKG